MSGAWVLPHLFKVQAANIDWGLVAELAGYEGPQQPSSVDYAPLQFRWLLHPSLGLPRHPFVLARNRHPGGSLTAQQLANLPDWEEVETVGLPVDDGWLGSGYELGPQGPRDGPLAPLDAAFQRLELGAPRIGWTRLTLTRPGGAVALPDWEPVVLDAYLQDLVGSRLLGGVRTMLEERPDPTTHAAYLEPEVDVAGTGRLQPRPLMGGAVGLAGQGEPAHSAWHPLGLLLLSAGIDPLASLALGFGTAIHQRGEVDDLYRVSVRHVIRAGGRDREIELADVVTVNDEPRSLEPPAGVAATLIGHSRPQSVDGPSVDTVGVSWRRALNPVFAHPGDDAPNAISYVIGRGGGNRGEILVPRRPAHVNGYHAFAASKPSGAGPVLFAHHRARAATIGAEVVGNPSAADHVYAVAAQDIFGRWSPWASAPYAEAAEPPHAPSILAVTLGPQGALVVDFGWDWSDRSPEFAELAASYEDDPVTTLLAARLEFRGAAEPDLGGLDVVPLDPALVPAGGWGAPQDRDPDQPETRFYRLSGVVPLHFAGRPRRVVHVRARGQCHLHERIQPGSGVSSFGPPFAMEVHDPGPPPPPVVPEAPQWATLRDVSGVSRATLVWAAVPGAAGYVVYEATETTLLAALGVPGPDTARAFTARLATLRGANLPALRSQFRRIREELIPAASLEVTLPRGSSVLHLYAVTAMSANHVESAWPSSSRGFIAVAAARARVPRAPSLEARLDAAPAGPVVTLRVSVDPEPPVGEVDIHRVVGGERPASVDAMGPPLATLANSGADATFIDRTLAPGWQRTWYRAVAWSARDDLDGFVEGRSPSSTAVSVLAPPPNAPSITGIRVNEQGSTEAEVLVSWLTDAPFRVTAFGPHRTVIEARDLSGTPLVRLDATLDTLARLESLASLPGPDAANRRISRVWTEDADRLYAWLPRPAGDQGFTIEAKVIDPLGRIGRATADVPTLASTLPVIDQIDPDNGSPGDSFTIHGSNLLLHPGDSVTVLLDIPTDPDAPPNPGPLALAGTPTSTTITVTIPNMPREGEFAVIVSRSDEAEAISEQTLAVRLL